VRNNNLILIYKNEAVEKLPFLRKSVLKINILKQHKKLKFA